MARVKVKVERGNGLQQVVVIDTGATKGATVGSDLYLNGAVATPAAMRTWLGVSAGSSGSVSQGVTIGSILTSKGDLATRNTQVQKLAIGAEDQALRVSSGGLPEWRDGAELSKTDDDNVTLTLGGAPSTALLVATSLTLGWTGTLSKARGGFGEDASALTPSIAELNYVTGVTSAIQDQIDAIQTALGAKQDAAAILAALAALSNAAGVLTNDGAGNLSWV